MRRFLLLATATFCSALILSACSDDNSGNDEQGETQATYTVTFESSWSAETHPTGFPANAHFSPLVGATHNNTVIIWDAGELASEGIEVMAETGGTTPLQAEVQDMIDSGRAGQILLGPEMEVSPGSVQMTFTITSDFPLVSLVSMLAPSPDWFLGVRSVNLLGGDGIFLDEAVVELQAYDSGTDSGTDYTSPNEDTNPAVPIFRILEAPFRFPNGTVPSIGVMRFEKTSGQ